jgi:hypothetical protein
LLGWLDWLDLGDCPAALVATGVLAAPVLAAAPPVEEGQASAPDIASVATALQATIAIFVPGNLVKIVILRRRLLPG